MQCVPCWLRADCVCLLTPVQQSRSGQVCVHVSRRTYLTLCSHLISPASTCLLDSTYPHHSCITVYTHTTHTHMYYTYFTVYTPPCNITLCTHMTPSSKCVPTQHPLHSVYPHNIHFTVCTRTTSISQCVPTQHPFHSVYPHNINLQSTSSFRWEVHGSQTIRADDAHPLYPERVDHIPRQSGLMS